MTRPKRYYSFSLLCILLVLLMQHTHCTKDYSYEGGPMRDTSQNGDTTASNGDTANTSSLYLPTCPSCNNSNDLKPDTWMFSVNGTVICGQVTNAVMNIEGTAITFFGPSACSQDTGLVVTAYLVPPGLSATTSNIFAQRVALEYYDNVKPSLIAEAKFTSNFSLYIERYTQQTGVATGTFKGQAVTAKGELVTIAGGKFNISFK